ncbi:hypothetical protein PCASD_26176 [Puccinia coronata f. sp. avenae]|uniref:Uncharacterized protein n=1 Tax=Puccinia coronata f. sp. avenae TaxID=200324 RepID=A0A2N5RVU1_9BASI|nr:hypothetical protein PCASD_26176 [Puccinia coronata f. sp. avenae]
MFEKGRAHGRQPVGLKPGAPGRQAPPFSFCRYEYIRRNFCARSTSSIGSNIRRSGVDIDRENALALSTDLGWYGGCTDSARVMERA